MKSRISFFDRTVFLKDLTRFAPAWILYSIVLVILGTITGTKTVFTYGEISVAGQLDGALDAMIIINFLFALLNAQLLFGDLFNTKLTNALHAMPIRRETWFGTHVISGLVFHFVPSTIFAVWFSFLCGEFWLTSWCWLGAVMLQYLFFFGLAVFACLCVGSRFAQGVVYGLCSFGAWLLFWTVDAIYMPLIPGISITFQLLSPFCPIIYGFSHQPFSVDIKYWTGMSSMIESQNLVQNPDGWIYLGIIAAIGVALLFLALQFYRRRNLEVAGDFIAVSWLKPVFLICYTLSMGVITYYLLSNFGVLSTVFLILGLLVGFVSGTMFLERTIKVFHKRMLTGLTVFAVFILGTMGLTALDPLGLQYWVPDVDQIESAQITLPGYSVDTDDLEVTGGFNPHIAERITAIHRAALKDDTIPVDPLHDTVDPGFFYDTWNGNGLYSYYIGNASYNSEGYQISLSYQIRGGIYMDRTYGIAYECPTAELVADFMNEPEQVLRLKEKDWKTQLNRFYIPPVEGTTYLYPTYAEAEALMNAIVADCENGTMLQHDCFHEERGVSMTVRFGDSHKGTAGRFTITVYPEAVNTRAWMEERGLYVLPEAYPPAEEAYFP